MTNNRKNIGIAAIRRICIFAPHHRDTQLRLYPRNGFLGDIPI
jgi:hypothetical protein